MYNLTTKIDFEQLIPLNNEGKNSTVYSFYDKQLGSDFIVKKIEKISIYEAYAKTSNINLFDESRILFQVKHPNIMEIQYASYDEDCIYMVMPICKNGSLNSLINKRFLTTREIIKYSLEFLLGLHYIHSKKLIHFDIKPTNILINDNNKAVITDFGLSKYINLYGLAQPNKLYNDHIPPEAYISPILTNKCDIYQAGVTMYRLCNGNAIFKQQFAKFISPKDKGMAICSGQFPDRNFYLPHIPTKLRKIINKCMDIDPDSRYDTVLDIINDLATVDKNLDLIYEEKNLTTILIKKLNDKMTFYNCLEITKTGNTYCGKGIKIKISDKTTSKINNWNFNNLSRTNVSKTIDKIFN